MTKQSSDQPTTRDRILAAAVVEIAEKGIGGIRTRGVAERAGVNNALIHYHFKSMDELIAEAAAGAFTAIADAAARTLDRTTVADGLDALSDMIDEIDPGEPGWQVLLEVMVHAPRNPRVGEFVLGWLRDYREATTHRLDRAVAEGELPEGLDTEGLSLALMALYDGLGLYAFVDPSFDVRRAGRSIADLFTRLQQGASP